MVYNRSKHIKLPFGGAKLHQFTGRVSSGRGMGSVLLQTGGPGAGSSYQSVDEYTDITGVDPYKRAVKPTGMGMSKMLDKIGLLKPIEKAKRRKNITMSM